MPSTPEARPIVAAAARELLRSSENGCHRVDVQRQVFILKALLEDGAGGAVPFDLDLTLQEMVAERSELAPKRILRGMSQIDKECPYFQDDLILVLGMSGSGKSMYVTNIAANNLNQGHRVAIVSLEMSKKMLLNRMLSRESGVAFSGRGHWSELEQPEYLRVSTEANRLRVDWKGRLFINDVSQCSWELIRSSLEQEHARDPFSMVIVDHFGLITHSRDSVEHKTASLEVLAKDMKAFQNELGCTFLVVSQVSKVVGTTRKTPSGAVLPEAGDEYGTKILSDAASIVESVGANEALTRMSRSHSDYESHKRNGIPFEVLVSKSRHSSPGQFSLRWWRHTQKIGDSHV